MTKITRRQVLAGAGTIGVAAVAGCSSDKGPAADRATATGSPAAPSATGSSAAGTGATSAAASKELKLGALADIPVGGGKLVTVDGQDLIVTQPVAGQPAVFVNRCTHQGCKVDFKSNELVCPCHASRFDLTGAVLHGPATEPLPPATLRVDNGQIIVEKL